MKERITKSINKETILKLDDNRNTTVETELKIISDETYKFPLPDKLLCTMQKERNLKKSTMDSYHNSTMKYKEFHKMTMHELLQEALLEEKKQVPLNNRKIKDRLLQFRAFLLKGSNNTAKSYFTKIKTIYTHYNITIPSLPQAKYNRNYEVSYRDLPNHEDIRKVLDEVNLDLRAVILFMTSSGTARAETLSLTVKHFIEATTEYHNGGDIYRILNTLSRKHQIVPTFYLERIKTNKWYYTYCTPQATDEIIKSLLNRDDLEMDSPLFPFTPQQLLNEFQKINDKILKAGFKGNYRFFRSHALRKFHASNIGLAGDYVDMLQGRSRNSLHETYIKINPNELKNIYKKYMKNVMIDTEDKEELPKEEVFNININIFLNGHEYTI